MKYLVEHYVAVFTKNLQSFASIFAKKNDIKTPQFPSCVYYLTTNNEVKIRIDLWIVRDLVW